MNLRSLLYQKQNKKVVSEVGFEPTPSFEDQNAHSIEAKSKSLESGALDRSAILTCLLGKEFKYLNARKAKFLFSFFVVK